LSGLLHKVHAWATASPTPTASPTSIAPSATPNHAQFPPTVSVDGGVFTAFIDLLDYILPRKHHRREEGDGRRRLQDVDLDESVMDGKLTCKQPRYDADGVVIDNFTLSVVPQWCDLAKYQPQVLGSFGMMDPKTIIIPNYQAFSDLLHYDFPAWYEYLSAFPSCRDGFNRMEYFLHLQSAPINITCGSIPAINGASETFRSLVFQSNEYLEIARLLVNNVTDLDTCKIANADCFDIHEASNVVAQYLGDDGTILVVDQVIQPKAHPLMKFPTVTLCSYIHNHPHLRIFSLLLNISGVSEDLCFVENDDFNFKWHSKTVFAPVDSSFRFLPSNFISYLNTSCVQHNLKALAKYIVLSHFLYGDTYTYDCVLCQFVDTWGNVTQRMQSNSIVTFNHYQQNSNGALLLSFLNEYDPGSAFSAHTLPPWTNIETTTGILHKIDGLLIDGCAQQVILDSVFDFQRNQYHRSDENVWRQLRKCQEENKNPFVKHHHRHNDGESDGDGERRRHEAKPITEVAELYNEFIMKVDHFH
jgi:Fasciclin domain